MAESMGYSLADLRAAMGDGDGFGSGSNGFIWLLLLWAMMGGNFNGNRYGCGEFLSKVGVEAASANQIDDLSRQVTQDALRGAIAGNHDAIDTLSKQLCCSTADITAAISGVNTAMLQGFSGIQSLVQSCCCSVKEKIGESTNQLNVNMLSGFNGLDKSILSGFNGVERGFAYLGAQISQGFASTAFETQKQTCEIIKNQDENTNKILGYLTNDKIEQLRNQVSLTQNELSNLKNTNEIIAAIKHNNCCNPCGGCGCC